MLAEIEHLGAHAVNLLPDDSSGEVDVVVLLREFCQFVHIVLQHFLGILVGTWGILVEFAHQHAIGSLSILVGTVSLEVVLHLASTVELVGGCQVAALHLLEDSAGVDESAFREVEVDTGTQELLGQQGHIEVVGVETGNIAAAEHLVELGSQLLEGRLVFHVLFRDARQLGDDRLNRTLRIDQFVASFLPSVGIDFNIG